MIVKTALLMVILLSSDSSFASDCVDWFLKSGLVPKTEDCELKCSITPVDMRTFSCSTDCEDLCSKSITERILKYVPRLTEGDELVISKMPLEALQVFVAKEKVDKLTARIFVKTGRNDESDAFRHFVWSVLLADEIGIEKAEVFLNAHEEDSTQNSEEKRMDLFNNFRGLKFYRQSKKIEKELSLDQIERAALSELRDKKLKVLNPRFKKIPGGYYSK